MANNPYKNKVVYNGATLIDLTGDTVTPDKLMEGYTAHDASGAPIVGTATGGGSAIAIIDTLDAAGGTIRDINAVSLAEDTVAPEYLLAGYTAHNSQGQAIVGTASNGGISIENFESRTEPSGAVVSTSTVWETSGLLNSKQMTSYKNLSVGNIRYPDDFFRGCSNVTHITIPNFTNQYGNGVFYGCSKLEVLDFGGGRVGTNMFNGCSALTTIIMRYTSLTTLVNTGAFTGTRFVSGGAGGTIYIPKVLYDHLGDGSSSDFKAATNWSVIDAYGTITWAQIEGSQYENYYADGTPIPSA